MIEAPRVQDEIERLRALYRYQVLDTEPETAFDELTALAAQICEAPAALITLIDLERQWFKSRCGFDAEQTHRNLSFCAHAILRPEETMIVPDTRLDDRTKGHPGVQSEPGIRFYAGRPLVTEDGHALGTLCVIDYAPRTLSPQQEIALRVLAREVVARLDQRRHVAELEELAKTCDALATEYARAAAARSRFIANVSHELRSPLMTILGFAEALRDPKFPAAKHGGALDAISRSGEHLLALVNDILDLGKIEAGALDIELRETVVRELLDDIELMCGPAAASKGVELSTAVRDAELVCRMDPTRVRQILLNLVTNAVKFTEVGSVRVSAAVDGSMLRFEVCDTGIGMTDEHLDRLFVPFQQAERSTFRRFGGTGLGMSVSKELAEALGGTLCATSALGTGTTMTLSIPYYPAAEARRDADVVSERRSAARVLVADDSPDNCAIVAFFLERSGYLAVTAQSCQETLERLEEEQFDIVLLDMYLPDGTGADIARQIRARHGSLPLIGFTASAADEDTNALRSSGCAAIIPKPVSRKDLLAAVEAALRSAAAMPREGAVSDLDRHMQQIISKFRAGLAARCEQLTNLIETSALDGLFYAAHALRGTAAMLGFDRVSEAARELEAAAQSRDVARARNAFPALIGEIRAVERSDETPPSPVIGARTGPRMC